jgi:hypothetical protein
MSRTSSELAHASPCAKAHQGTTEEARDWQCMLYHTRADCCALLAQPAIPRFHGSSLELARLGCPRVARVFS